MPRAVLLAAGMFCAANRMLKVTRSHSKSLRRAVGHAADRDKSVRLVLSRQRSRYLLVEWYARVAIISESASLFSGGPLIRFLAQLFESGEIVVPRQSGGDTEEVTSLLQSVERIRRQSWPGEAPEFIMETAKQASAVLLLFCEAVVYREIDEESITGRLQEINLISNEAPTTHYSADLVLRFLPQVYERLKRTSKNDPAIDLLKSFAKHWPLSSVGIPECAPQVVPNFLKSPSLIREYVNRIIGAADTSRLNDSEIANAISAAIGQYDFLAPQLARSLAQYTESDP